MPTLYIIRGLPGSGKSTLARKIVRESNHREADMFFMVDGEYQFDAEKKPEAHAWCFAEVARLMSEKADIAVSNTFTQRVEYDQYIQLAQENEYDIQIIECHGPWGNVHEVPEEVYEAMASRWEPHRPLLVGLEVSG